MSPTSRSVRRAKRPIRLPQMGLFASLLFLPTLLLFTAGRITVGDSPQPEVHLPFTSASPRCRAFAEPRAVISIDAEQRLFISYPDRIVQSEVVQKVAEHHGIFLSAHQLGLLNDLPYFGTDVRQLPAYLSLSPKERKEIELIGIPANADNNQFDDFLATARVILRERERPLFITLRADSTLPAATVQHVIGKLQQRGINRFELASLSAN